MPAMTARPHSRCAMQGQPGTIFDTMRACTNSCRHAAPLASCLQPSHAPRAHPPGRVQRLHGVTVRSQQGGEVEPGAPLARL